MYFNNPVPEDKQDLRRFIDAELKSISDDLAYKEERLRELTVAGYGGMIQDADILYDITAAYATLPFDTQSPVAQRGVVINLANDSISFNRAGVWRLSYGFSLAGHDSVNAGRVVNFRFYDVTVGAPRPFILSLGIGRNVEDTTISGSRLIEITEDIVGNELRIELGGGDSVIGGTLIAADYQVNHLGELGELLLG